MFVDTVFFYSSNSLCLLKRAASRFAHVESLTSLSSLIRVNLFHPCSFMVSYYFFGDFNLENIYIFQVVVVGRFHSITWSLPVRHSAPGGGGGGGGGALI